MTTETETKQPDLTAKERAILNAIRNCPIGEMYSAEIVDASGGMLALGNILDHLEAMQERGLVASRPHLFTGRSIWSIPMITDDEPDPRESHIKYCDICGRSEIDAMIDDRGELLNIEYSPDDGCMICDECMQPIAPAGPDEIELQQRGELWRT